MPLVARLIAALALLAATLAAPAAAQTADPAAGRSATDGAVAVLAPPDATSPRATLLSFRDRLEALEDAYDAYRASKTLAGQRRVLVQARALRGLFDLSETPPALRAEIGDAAFAYLADVLARLPVPRVSDLPGGPDFDPSALGGLWRVPGTEITLERMSDGPREGVWLFSADTVARLPEFHALVIDRPIRPGLDTFESWRREQVAFTGHLIPYAWIDALPDSARVLVFDTPVYKIVAALALLLAGAVAVGLWLVRVAWAGNSGHVAGYLRRLSTPALLALAVSGYQWVALWQINLSGSAAHASQVLTSVVHYVAAAWAAWLAIFLAVETIISSPRIADRSYDAHLLRLLAKVAGVLAVVVIAMFGATDLGIPAFGVAAGLGVGGLAFALAAQVTVENLFGGFNLFADRPFRVGEFIGFGGMAGSVERIGPRSTRLCQLDGTQVTVPNADLSRAHIVNFTRREAFFFQHVVGLRYETTPAQLDWIAERVTEMLREHPAARSGGGFPLAAVTGFGASSIDMEARGHFHAAGLSDFMALQQELLLAIARIVEEGGSGMAFPSTTAYLARDRGLDAALAAQIEDAARQGQPRRDSAAG